MGWMKTNLLLLSLCFPLLGASLLSSEEAKPEMVIPLPEAAAALPATEIVPQETAFWIFDKKADANAKPAAHPEQEAGYTINYTTVSILEYIRFASKISNVNFIYNEADLNFTITVVSDAPMTSENVMATLLQVLRIHGLQLLEQDNSLVIHNAPGVQQIATLVVEGEENKTAPIVTRIFRVKNVKPDSVAAIIRPMISTGAILEVSAETRQLILTDITANVNKVAALIENLDSPQTLLEIRSYEATNNKPEYLISLGSQMMNPIAQGNPFILVPQSLANTIFIVSTPELADKAIAVFKSLDTPPKKEISAERKLKSENIFIYKVQNRSGDQVLKGLANIAKSLEDTGIPEQDLIDSIDTAKWIRDSNSITVVGSKDSIDKIKEFLAALDVPSKDGAEKTSFFVFKPQNRSASEVEKSILEIADNLKDTGGADPSLISAIESVKINDMTHTLVFSGEEKNFPRIQELLNTIDNANGRRLSSKNNFYLYKLQQASETELENSLKSFARDLSKSNVSDDGLADVISHMKYIKETNSILFTGPDAALKRLQDIVPSFDTGSAPPSTQFYVYKPVYQKGDKLADSLKEMTDQLKADKLADPGLLRALESMKWVKSTNSLLFTGDPASLQRIEALIGTTDAPMGPKAGMEKNFFLFQPQYANREKTESYLRQISDNLSKRNEEDLVETIRTAKWIDSSKSFMFYGSDSSMKRLKELLANFDTPDSGKGFESSNFLMYKPKVLTASDIQKSLQDVAANLKKANLADPALLSTIDSSKYVEATNSIVFTGPPDTLSKIQSILNDVDVRKSVKPGYYIYKVQNTTGDAIEEDLDQLAKDFKSSGLQDTKIIDVINKIRYVKETNSLLLSGDPQAVDEVKAIVADYDYPREMKAEKSNFYMYKPQHLPAAQVQKSLIDVGSNLKKAGLADSNLLAAIDSAKYVDSTNSLIFTGSPDALLKIQGLIKDIDIPPASHAPIQKVGKTTFLLYKLKNASGPQIVSSLQNMASNIKKSGTSDKDFVAALESMKYVKETNSLFFTGTEESLGKIQTLVEQFDVTSMAPVKVEAPLVQGPSNFFVYKPQSLAGPDLEKILTDFADNLKSSGLADPDLFNSITSMRWIEKTQSLVFTGTPKALDQIKELLKTFDIPSNLPEGTSGGPMEASIQAIDNTSFLVYKLQFHKGDEIQGALRQIAKDLILSNAPVNQNLLNSINSIQWLEVTNSLLCSGDQETLTRLRELIKNLDIPLKQVYIEMLVIQTTLANALQFGLEWSANYKYRNKFSTVMNNTPPSSGGTTYTPDTLFQSLQNTLLPPSTSNPTAAAPTPQMIPASGHGNFDLGVIGEVIRHNGQTFLTLGSLLTALQTDAETSVILTPKILTQDGKTSSIFVGNNIPFVGSFVSNTASNATVNTSNLEYRDIGLNLTVTPVLGNSDIVTLDINLDQTQTVGATITGATIDFANQTANGIVTSKTSMQTTVHVPDNNFLILSGMVNSSDVKTQSAIPCLGGLPIIGAAFSQSNETVANANLVIFIRPHIINSLDDMRSISSKEEEFFRDQTGTPFLEHNFNEAMELIKTIDDE